MGSLTKCIPATLGTVLALAVALPAPSQISLIVDVPPDPAPRWIGSNTQLNVLPGGTLPSSNSSSFQAGSTYGTSRNVEVNLLGGTVGDAFQANKNSVVRISGGRIGSGFDANSGSQVTISGGRIGSGFDANPGSQVTISGGSFGMDFDTSSRSDVTFSGGEFLLNGRPVSGAVILNGSGVFTGTLEDGSPFIFSREADDGLADDGFDGVILSNAPLPHADTTPIIIESDSVLNGLREGQTLILREGGTLPENFAAVNAELNIAGGEIGDGLEVAGSDINISSGIIGNQFHSYSGSQVSISGGTIGDDVRVWDGVVTISGGVIGDNARVWDSVVTISGGTFGQNFAGNSGSVVTISGGTVVGSFVANEGSIVTVSGGTINEASRAATGSEVTISGGTLDSFSAEPGSQVTISGGRISSGFDANPGSQVTISGGSFGMDFRAFFDSDVTVSGGEFLLNGVALPDGPVSLRGSDVLTGTLEDGSPFIFLTPGNRIDRVVLSSAPLPAQDVTPILIDRDKAPSGLREGQTLTLEDGGVLPENFVAVNSNLNILGGEVGDGLQLAGSRVTISGGVIGWHARALSGSEVTISGGTIGREFEAHSGSIVTITGGTISPGLEAHSGSVVTISGETIGWGYTANSGSIVTITGGTIGSRFGGLVAKPGSAVTITGGEVASLNTWRGSQVHISGGEFLLNGDARPDGPITLTGSDVLTGTLEDGSPFIFSRLRNDRLDRVMLSSAPLPTSDTMPIIVTDANVPSGLRNGQTMILLQGGSLPEDYSVVNASLSIVGGTVGAGLKVAGSQVTISDGIIGSNFTSFDSDVAINGGSTSHFYVYSGSDVKITGGMLEWFYTSGSSVAISGGSVYVADAHHDSNVIVSGGTVDYIYARPGSTVTISGGTEAVAAVISTEGVVNMSGGAVESFHAALGSELNIFGREFEIDGSAIPPPLFGNAVTVSARNAELTGLLADGAPFTLHLWGGGEGKDDIFATTLTVTRVSLLPGDYNSNGVVDQADLDLVLLNWGDELADPYGAGWINDIPNGLIDQEELDKVLRGWGDTLAGLGAIGVPEPVTRVLSVLLLVLHAIWQWRRPRGAQVQGGAMAQKGV